MDFKKRLESIIELIENKLLTIEEKPLDKNTPIENIVHFYSEVVNVNRAKDKKRASKFRQAQRGNA